MSAHPHTYQQNCRLAPINPAPTDVTSEDTPRIAARFFYTSLIPIDDPLSHGTLAHASDIKSAKSRLRPFSQGDNIALERTWLSLVSEKEGSAHHRARNNEPLGPAIEKANAKKLKALVLHLAAKHYKKHVGSVTSQSISTTPSAPQPTTPAALCCSELYLDVSADLQNTFCALVRRRQSSLAAESVIEEVMRELRRMLSESESGDGSTSNNKVPSTSAARQRADSTRSAQFTFGSPPARLEATKSSALRIRSGSRATQDSRCPETPVDSSLPRVTLDDGISGTPFARVGSLGATPESSPSAFGGRIDKTEVTIGSSSSPRELNRNSKRTQDSLETAEAHDIDDAQRERRTIDLPVGISRLHMVSLPALQMKPIYWSPVNDIAVVLRGTWFYRDTMIPLPPAVANQMEAGYGELKPYTETWRDELRCAIEVGPLGEEKVSHRLWPDEKQSHDGDTVVDDAVISTDPFCAARCFNGEAATQGSIIPQSDSNTVEQPQKSFASYHVIYKDASHAFLLKPSLKPSAYYGRRPVAKIMRGTTIGIPVVRGFDQDAWDKIQDKKPSEDKGYTAAGTPDPSRNDGRDQVCPACKAQKDRGQVTDLILVCHGIGQKFAERVESFHFTHAINAFRREVNLELGNPSLKGSLRETQNGIMVLPVNWRHTLTLENGGPVQEREDEESHGLDRFGLKDIEPKTIPAVRSMISDIMFDIPFYMSHHKGQMIEALVKEANRVYRLWCRNNPGFHEQGRVHLIGHSLGSAMAVDILSRQPSRVPSLDLSLPLPRTDIFEFDTRNLFLAGSPAGFFMLLERGRLLPRRGRTKPGADPNDVNDHEVTGEAGSFGCLAVDNIYNILAREDPIAYLLNGTIDPAYAASLKTAYVPSTATSFLKYVGDTMRGIIPGTTAASAPAPDSAQPEGPPKPSVARLPSQLELEVHDFTREEIAEKKAYLLNDNGQIDFYLRSGGGPLEIQYLNMLSAHSSYWLSRDFIRMLCVEVGRRPGRSNTVVAMRAQKSTKRVMSPTGSG